jgi:hypothetical protein
MNEDLHVGCEYCHKQMIQEDIDKDKVIWFYDGWYHRKCYHIESELTKPTNEKYCRL